MMTREELIALVERIRNVEGTEEEVDEWLEILRGHVPDPEVTRLIYWNRPTLTSAEIVDRALAYKPIILGASTKDS